MPKKLSNEESFKTTLDSHSMWSAGEFVAVTISPPPSHQHFQINHKSKNLLPPTSYAERKMKFVKEWNSYLKLLSGIERYEFYVEISRYGLLHLHGTVKISCPERFNHSVGALKYMNGVNIDVDTIKDPGNWDEYIKKDYPIMGIKLTKSTTFKKGILEWCTKSEA